jgi:hypothetical protein
MSELRRQREAQLGAIDKEREQAFRFAEDMQDQVRLHPRRGVARHTQSLMMLLLLALQNAKLQTQVVTRQARSRRGSSLLTL